MTTAQINGPWVPSGAVSPIPPIESVPLAAASSNVAGRGQILTFDSSGNAVLNGGSTANVVAAGVAYPTSNTGYSTVAAGATTNVDVGLGEMPMSTAASDGFTASDVLKPGYGYDENTVGKKSNTSGTKRPLLGLVFGITNASESSPRAKLWSGRVGQLMARALAFLTSAPLAWYTISDAAANTATAERAIASMAVIGQVTSVDFIGAAVAADNADYVTITIKKYGAADSYAAGSTVATYDSRAANQGAIAAFTPASFALSGTAANLSALETDVYTLTIVKGGAGKVLTGAIRINGKVI